jgi:exo-beta-1,3-glucanase (GH17 family)
MDEVDGVAYHPYSYPDLPTERTGNNGFVDQLAAVRKVMVDHGDGHEQIWLTEFGFPTPGGQQAALARQEEMVSDAFRLWRSLDYAGPFFWFAWRDPETGSADPQRNFGLRFHDDRAKPAFGVFAQELRR